jgi:hypothetical protein
MKRKPRVSDAQWRGTLDGANRMRLQGHGNLILAQDRFGSSDKGDKSRNMPEDQRNCRPYDISTSNPRFRTSMKHTNPD